MIDPSGIESLQQQLREVGYCVLQRALPGADIDAHLEVFEAASRRHRDLDPGPIPGDFSRSHASMPARPNWTPRELTRLRRIRARFFERDTTHLKLTFNPLLVRFATACFRREPVLVNAGTSLYCRGSGLHSDMLNAAATDPWEHMLRFWCALEDIDAQSGPLALYPGSHRAISATVRDRVLAERPEFLRRQQQDLTPVDDSNRQQRFAEASAQYRYMTELVERQLSDSGSAPAIPQLRRGDVLVFNPAVIHASSRCENPSLTRKSYLFTFCARDAKWFSPRVYWGALHDHRSEANAMYHETELTAYGLRVTRYGQTLAEYERRSIQPVE